MELVEAIGAEFTADAAATTAVSAATTTSAADAAFLAHAAAATTTAASAGSSAFSLSTLSTGLSLASMSAAIFGGQREGKAASEALKNQSDESLLIARQEELKGKQDANDILQNMIQTIAAQRLAFSGAGVDPSFGTPASLAENTRTLAESQLSSSRDNTMLQVLSRRREAFTSLSERDSAYANPIVKGVTSAVGTGADLVARRIARG